MEELLVLKPLPENVTFAISEKAQLKNYEDKINSMDVKGANQKLSSEIDQKDFARQVVKLRKSYNKCVDVVNQIEKKKNQDKFKIDDSFMICIDQLDVVVKYVLLHYKL